MKSPARAGIAVALATTLAVALLAAVSIDAPRPGFADPLADAKAQAAQLQKQVTALTTKAEQATERYNAAEAALLEVIAQQNAARKQAAAAQLAAAADRAAVASRARALYKTGSPLSGYTAVLNGADPGRVLIAVHDMQAISDADKRLLSTTTAHSDAAQSAKDQLDALLNKQADLEHQADDALQQVHDTLATQQQALDDANNQVRTLEAALQARLDAESAARAAAMLNQARMAALAGGFTDGQASPWARAAIAAASTQLGKPYVYGGSGPDVWDCSGLTQWAYRQAGIVLPRTAAEQYLAVSTKVPLGELEPGDLLFWATDPANPATIHHVAIYLGNAQMLAAPHTGTVVQIQPVYLDGYFGAVRPG